MSIMYKQRSNFQKLKDFLTLPIRSFLLYEKNVWGLSSTMNERLEYASMDVIGRCLDIGCGKNNLFINKFLDGNGVGVDVFKYDGLTDDNIVEDMTKMPFENCSFNSVTFIASLNHVPKKNRDKELLEAYRVLKDGGNVIVTMPCALAGILIHKFVYWYDKIFKTSYDVDTIRGMDEDEEYYLCDSEIKERLKTAGFKNIKKRYFLTQWGMNHSFVAWKVKDKK